MTSLIGIRRRIRSTKNISQITKAMQMVSASKMRKAQDAALATRPFTEKLRSILGRVAGAGTGSVKHELTEVRPEKKVLAILVSTTKGLCGGLNVNLHRGFMNFALENPDTVVDVATVGKKARWVIPGRDTNLVARFDNLKETPSFEETRSITSYAMDKYLDGTYDAIYLVYPKFISTLTNQVTVEKILPVSPVNGDSLSTSNSIEYKIEPDPQALMQKLIPYQVEMSMYQSLLESRATEHSARMVAMKNASDNAKDLIASLTLDYNSARQSQVTSELLDVTTARMAIE
ncbi:ATP synthase F1 subunit gamma [Candidatus Woesebacteria bacterium]|nr:ATP synthase F1 subunit gamma [Candidatus Woesebacteria bacterium]